MVEESQKNEKGVPKEEDLDQCGAAASYVQKKYLRNLKISGLF